MAHALGRLVLDDVGKADDTDEHAVGIGDHDARFSMLAHQRFGVTDAVARPDRNDVGRQDRFDTRRGHDAIIGARTNHDVAIGDDAEHLAVLVAHGNEADVVLAHLLRQGAKTVGRSGSMNVPFHDFFASHAVGAAEFVPGTARALHGAMSTHTVGEWMSTSPHTIGADQPLSLAHEKMRTERIRHLPVLSAKKIVGILSDRDVRFLESFKDVDPRTVNVEEAMSTDVYTVDANAELRVVAETMAEHKYGSAVVTRGAEVVGVLTTTDICRAVAKLVR